MNARVEVFYSLQSDYCYFLVDRLLGLNGKGVDVVIRPVLGAVIRLPERYESRDAMEARYFETDTARTAEFLGLPYAYPDPSPITFKPGSIWVPEAKQPLNEFLNRLYVGAERHGKVLNFLDTVGRSLWDGSAQNWHEGDHLSNAMRKAGLVLEDVLDDVPWDKAKKRLDENAGAILAAGHWGVPLMVYNGEAFYGQDRFDQLVWRMTQEGDIPC